MRDRSALAQRAGPCERAFRLLLATQETDLRDARIEDVKVRGSRAFVSYRPPGVRVDDGRLLALKDGERWGLISEETLNEDRTGGRDAKRPLPTQGSGLPAWGPILCG